jgi:hypothetical protein
MHLHLIFFLSNQVIPSRLPTSRIGKKCTQAATKLKSVNATSSVCGVESLTTAIGENQFYDKTGRNLPQIGDNMNFICRVQPTACESTVEEPMSLPQTSATERKTLDSFVSRLPRCHARVGLSPLPFSLAAQSITTTGIRGQQRMYTPIFVLSRACRAKHNASVR